MAVSRETLYYEVWSEPMIMIAARYGVSSSFMARVCERLNVPRPARGYWAKLRVGKAPDKPALPPPGPGDELEWSRDGTPRRLSRALPKAPGASKRPKKRKGQRPAQHSLLLGAKEHFGKVRSTRGDYLRPFKKLLVDVFTSKDVLDAALDLANELFLTIEDRGYTVEIPSYGQSLYRKVLDVREEKRRESPEGNEWSPCRPTVVFVGTVAIGLTVYEMTENAEVRWVDGKYLRTDSLPKVKRRIPSWQRDWTHMRDIPSGRLAVRAFSPYQGATWEERWSEKKSGQLQSQIKTIAREIAKAAPTIAKLVEKAEREAEIAHKRWEAEKLKWEREQAERRRIQAIKQSQEDLLTTIERWALACRIESFFEDVAGSAEALDSVEQDAIFERLSRARELFGGPEALKWFRSWKTPEER